MSVVMVFCDFRRLKGAALRAMAPDQRTTASSGGTGFQPVSSNLQTNERNLPHWQLGGSTYFVTFRTKNASLSDHERQTVLDACFYWHGDRCTTHLAVVMPDHVHLLVTPAKRAPSRALLPRLAGGS